MATDRQDTPAEFCRWLLTLDDPADPVGREDRRTVTLSKIIDRARAALRDQDARERAVIAASLDVAAAALKVAGSATSRKASE